MNTDAAIKAWFQREVLPLAPGLTRFIRRKWSNESDVADLRQEVFARVYLAAREGLPAQAKAFVYAVARNHMIDIAKSAHVVSMRHVTDLESAPVLADFITPDRTLLARDELRRLEQGLSRLPPRCREVVYLRKVEGLSTREVAEKLGVTVNTVEQQTLYGIRALNDFMRGGSGKIQRMASVTTLSPKVSRR